MTETIIKFCICIFELRGFPPRPCLRTDKIQNPRRISKTLVSILRILLPENSFAKPSPHCIGAFPALLLLQKLCASHRGASARGERLCSCSSLIFAKMSSSLVSKILQNYKLLVLVSVEGFTSCSLKDSLTRASKSSKSCSPVSTSSSITIAGRTVSFIL